MIYFKKVNGLLNMNGTYLTNTDTTAYIGKTPLPTLFAVCAQQYPSNIALSFDDLTLTYNDINNRVNQFANFLLVNNVEKEDRIAVALDRSPEMLITLLAILKAGAAYIPLDPEYPKDRIDFMLDDSSAKILITSKKYSNRFHTTAKQLFIEDTLSTINNFQTDEPETDVSGEDLAYILYTSGSTGKPKGVLIQHHSLTNLLVSMQKTPGITDTDTLLSVTTVSFDIAALELFLPLISGARLIITNTETAKDSRVLLKIIRSQNVSIMQATPNTWRMMLESGWDEKLSLKILCGGEALTLNLAQSLVSKCNSLWNMYGPTETTIWSTIKQISPTDEIITIGNPIAETEILILDENNNAVKDGETGEICIGGAGLARGYLNRSQLTNDKFINYQVADQEELRLYKTGDLGKFLSNGEIQCFGRIDSQVKINGFRIELEEIEKVIKKSGLVSETVVVTREGEGGNKNLIAYGIPDLVKVKLKEKELYEKQLENWEKVYDTEYDHSESILQSDTSPHFDTNIWTDSFTIKIIPAEQMQEWLTDIVKVILAENPRNLLEIGCGTGLIYYQLAPHLKKYIGTDISQAGINALNKEINKPENNYPETKLMVCGAHEIALPANEPIDTIVINSVIQYFPGEDYLSEVLAKSIALLSGKGKIILGDVRDLRLLKLFKSYLFLSKLPAGTDKKEFAFLVDQEVLKEEELCVAPEYFYNLRSIYPQITHIDIQWKQGDYINELIAYRYTVVIYVGIQKEVIKPQWINWSEIKNKQSVKLQIQNQDQLIALNNCINPRLVKESFLKEGINDKALNTTGEISTYILNENRQSTDIGEIIAFARSNGYQTKFLLNNNPLKLNLVLELQHSDTFIDPLYSNAKQVAFTNIPLLSTICTAIQHDIYKVLLEQLPSYMIPANLVMLSHLPVTYNGKVDRQFLKQRNSTHRLSPVNYRGPRNDVEKRLVSIWQQLLGIENISIDDNFFELGGNSLIAIRIMITLEKEAGKDLPLSSLFEYPTIEQLSTIIQNTTNTNAPNESRCLVRLKPEGSKVPLYIIHGWGLTVFLFKDLAKNLHPDQPVFALQGIGVDGYEEPLTNVEDIAARYISEILEQNPTGPYAFAGYSLGGVIACEIVKQLRILGKQITILAMFDAYAHSVEKKANTNLVFFSFKKLNKFFLRINHNLTQLIKDPNTWNEKMTQINRKLPGWVKKNNVIKLKKDNDVDFYSNDLSKVYFSAAVQNYKLSIYEGTIELFRASKNIYYYMDDPLYLGWQQYAKTVNLHRIKGTHTTMFMPPNEHQFAEVLQQCLDEATKKNV